MTRRWLHRRVGCRNQGQTNQKPPLFDEFEFELLDELFDELLDEFEFELLDELLDEFELELLDELLDEADFARGVATHTCS